MKVERIEDPFELGSLGVSEIPDREVLRSASSPQVAGEGTLPHAGISGYWELPAATGRSSSSRVRTRARFPGEEVSLTFERHPRLLLPAGGDTVDCGDQTVITGDDPNRKFDPGRLLMAIQTYGDSLHKLFEMGPLQPTIIEGPGAVWMPSQLFAELMCSEIEREKEPPVETIVKIEEKLHRILEELRVSLRRVLRRRRHRVPLGRVEALDAGCMQWLARQPGRNLRERAGPDQEILAVVREHTVDTFENRVLKACLQLISEEAQRYVLVYGRQYPSHDRIVKIKGLRRTALEMLRSDEFAPIAGLSDDSKPNYALQFERRYSVVWWAYQQLKRRRISQDALWRWRHRVWSEIVFVDLFVAAVKISDQSAMVADREIGVLRDPRAGHWLHQSSRLPDLEFRTEQGHFRVGLAAPMHKATPETHPHHKLCDITVSKSSDGAFKTVAYITAIAEFLPVCHVAQPTPRRLVIRPCRSADKSPLEMIESDIASQSVIPWPIWGSERIEFAGVLLRSLLLNGECS